MGMAAGSGSSPQPDSRQESNPNQSNLAERLVDNVDPKLWTTRTPTAPHTCIYIFSR